MFLLSFHTFKLSTNATADRFSKIFIGFLVLYIIDAWVFPEPKLQYFKSSGFFLTNYSSTYFYILKLSNFCVCFCYYYVLLDKKSKKTLYDKDIAWIIFCIAMFFFSNYKTHTLVQIIVNTQITSVLFMVCGVVYDKKSTETHISFIFVIQCLLKIFFKIWIASTF